MEISGQSQTGQAFKVGIQNRPVQRKIGVPAIPPDLDQAGIAQFLHMVRDSRGAENGVLLEQAASQAIRTRYLLQDGVAMRVGKRTTDGAKLRVG